ncbi:MAG: YceD family protein [Alphaproteobacteria bacterium]
MSRALVATFTRVLDAASIRGNHALTIRATDQECIAIARFLGILGLESLSAQFVVNRSRRGDVELDGRLQAKLTQACVVSLVAVPQDIVEEVHRRFVPNDRSAATQHEPAVVDADVEDPPEFYPPAGIDVGAVVLEQLALALEPYPRAPGVTLPDIAEAPEDEMGSPFAVLKSLGHSNS